VDCSNEEEPPLAAQTDANEVLEGPESAPADEDTLLETPAEKEAQASAITEEQENSTETPDSDKEQDDSAADIHDDEDRQAEEDFGACKLSRIHASDDEQEQKPHFVPKEDPPSAWSSCLDGWVRPKARRRRRRPMQVEEQGERLCACKRDLPTWSSGWWRIDKRCGEAAGLWVLFERPISESKAEFLRATVKNTFVNIPEFFVDEPSLVRARSLPDL